MKKRYAAAINEALHEEMERDPRVVLFGEDVEASMFGDTAGLLDRFGRDRVKNTPISEQALAGMTVGMAASGYRPVLHLMFGNFVYTAMDAIGNQMARIRLMTGGQMELPLTVIAVYGGGRSSAAQHSDAPHPVLMNIGGINVLMPTSPADAKGLLKTAVRDNNPCFFLEAGGRGGEMGEVPDGEHLVPLGSASILREGRDVTLVSIGTTMRHTRPAVDSLVADGIDVELIDPRTVVPLDYASIIESVRKTGHLVVMDEARDACSAASQICAVIAGQAFSALKAGPMRITVPDVSLPYAPVAERSLIPNPDRIERQVRALLGRAPKQQARTGT